MPAAAIRRSPACTVGTLILTPAPKLPLAVALPISVTPVVGVTPVPERGTLCGLPPALSVILTVALREPATEGENVTLIVQLAPDASVAGLSGQLADSAKSAAFVPPTAILLIVSGAVPLLVRVIVCAALVVPTFWLPKLALAGLSVTPGADVTPVPERGTLCGLPPALSLMLTVAVRAPFADGVKVTLIVQLAVAARMPGLAGQLSDSVKSAVFVPFTVMPLIVSAAVPLFVSVID